MPFTLVTSRMFPFVQVTIGGLEPHVRYQVLLEIVPTSPRRQKYVNYSENEDKSRKSGGWTAAGSAEAQSPLQRRIYLHPDGPASGKHWMQQPVSFAKLKLTNNSVDHHNNIVLTSMHKYVPRIWIIQSDGFSGLSHQPSACFVFEETEFIAVTAYQNENITKLKINNNPFAKGFREMGQYRWKRKHDEEETLETAESPKAEEAEKVEVRQQNSEDVAANRPPRLHRPWTTSSPPPQAPRNPNLPIFQLNSNFSTFQQISLSQFHFSANFHLNNLFPQKFYR